MWKASGGMRTHWRRALAALALATGAATANAAELPENGCAPFVFEHARFIVCHFDARRNAIRLWHADEEGRPFRHFSRLRAWLRNRGQKLTFAMNAGMFTPEYAPAGLYIENGALKKRINLRRGYGNFHLLPNGIFWVEDGRAGVTESHAFDAAFRAGKMRPRYATQSGPMLVIDGHLHPKFRAGSDSLKIRNGVGVRANGHDVFFALSRDRVNFHTFAQLFRDALNTPNALFLDGGISQIYSPAMGFDGNGIPIGPIVGVALPEKAPKKEEAERP